VLLTGIAQLQVSENKAHGFVLNLMA